MVFQVPITPAGWQFLRTFRQYNWERSGWPRLKHFHKQCRGTGNTHRGFPLRKAVHNLGPSLYIDCQNALAGQGCDSFRLASCSVRGDSGPGFHGKVSSK